MDKTLLHDLHSFIADTHYTERGAILMERIRAALSPTAPRVLVCEGSCSPHFGDVKRVKVQYSIHDWGEFNYCEAAIAEDETRGMTVTLVTAPTAEAPINADDDWSMDYGSGPAPKTPEVQDHEAVRQDATPAADAELTHTRSCPALNPNEECTCGLVYRQREQTAVTISYAWMKRANEVESKIAALSAGRAELIDEIQTVREQREAHWRAKIDEERRATKAEGERDSFAHDANEYCLILREMGMDEEGNPLVGIQQLKAAVESANVGLAEADAELAIMREELRQYKEWSEYACKRYKDETGRDLQASAG